MQIFGLAGTNGSGKDTIAELLGEKYDYFVGSATDMFVVELNKRGWPTDRAHKRKLSAEWRKEFGLGVVVDKAIEEARAKGYDKVIVGSLRNSGEADRVHELGGQMIWADADPKIRYERIISGNRGRGIEDNKTYEEFLSDEEIEMHPTGDATTLDMAVVKQKSDIFIENDGDDIEAFKAQAIKLLNL